MDSSPSASEDESGKNQEQANSSTTKPVRVRKDRVCPFCKQIFTSSSLGRHLDFFIRDKRPKLPDGVHDVDQIRKLRSAITRRHARTSAGLKKEQQDDKNNRSESVADGETKADTQSGYASTHHTPNLQPQLPLPVPPPPRAQPLNMSSAQSTQMAQAPSHQSEICELPSLSRPSPSSHDSPHLTNWTATGVINNLPPRSSSGRFPRLLPRPDLHHNRAASLDVEEIDTARATELALREVLETLGQAIAQETQKPIFEFDFMAMSFPALCLRLLSPPPTLRTAAPMSTPSTWPTTGAPGRTHFEAIHEVMVGRLQELQVQQTPDHHNVAMMQPYLNHLNDIYRHWEAHSSSQQQNLWMLELLRTLASERSSKSETERKLDESKSEVQSLKDQLETTHSQHPLWPRDSPNTFRRSISQPLRLDGKAVHDLHKSGIDVKAWNYDALITKWKPVAQSERSRRPWPASLPRTPVESNVMPPLRSINPAAPHHNNIGPSMHAPGYTPPTLRMAHGQSTYQYPRNASARSSIHGMDGEDRDGEYENEDEVMGGSNQVTGSIAEQSDRYRHGQTESNDAVPTGPGG